VLVPSKTKKQAKFMAAVANNPKFAKRAGVPQSVGRDFVKADKGKTFQEGGDVNRKSRLKSLRNEIEESRRVADRRPKDAQERKDKSDQLSRINREEKADMLNMGGKVKGYMRGGKTQGYNDRLDESMGARNGSNSQSMASRRNESKGMEKSMGRGAYSGASTMMKKGGKVGKSSASSRGDGCAVKGHTKGRMV
jgi:hypothetical protein